MASGNSKSSPAFRATNLTSESSSSSEPYSSSSDDLS